MASFGLYNTKTTYQNDYIPHKLRQKEEKSRVYYDPSDNKPVPPRPRQLDLETLQPFRKDVFVPLDLFYRKKTVVATNPHEKIPLVKLEEKIFEEKLKKRKTRLRVYLVPQICLDDVPEDIMYGENGLAANIYTSDWKQYTDIVQSAMACKNSLETSKNKPKTEYDILAAQNGMNSVRFNPSHACVPMDVGMKKYARDWDRFQPRAIVDKNKTFWKRNRDKALCSICEGLDERINLSQAEKREIKEALADDLIRNPYSLLPPGYSGYKPKVALGIGLRKKLFKKFEPYVTSLMEVQGVYSKLS